MMPAILPEQLAEIQSFEDLARFCHEVLGWPSARWRTFEGVPELYGIQPEEIPGVQRLAAVQKLDAAQTWGIFLVDYGNTPMKFSALRSVLNEVATKARKQHANPTWPHDNILFVIRHKGGAFALAHYTGETWAKAKLRVFGWEDVNEARTLIEHNLPKLKWDNQGEWHEAWNVEKLTREFFSSISELFFDAMEAVKENFPDENERRLFIQTLFNRLIFLRFVEKKGWLKLNGRHDYLRALWEAGKDGKNPFWPTRLNALFDAVNHPTSDNAHRIAKPLIGDVPYLNGGLFDEDHHFADPDIHIPDEIFKVLLGPEGLFYRYNFTVEESTPLDVQVAVDPEILGKIFEQLTIANKRHDTGSYYTPREIVQFMCREALVGYLEGKGLPEEKARALVYEHDDSALTNQEGNLAFEALKAIKVVDPACGSGAYLLGMLQELYALFEKLRRDDRKFSDDPAKEAHERKLWIIENNLYGVDIQAFATNTAMLRLWLTLLVEDTGEAPQPLPNLEYKIETGDSLLGPDPSQPVHVTREKAGQQVIYDSTMHEDIERLRTLRARYQDSHGKAKVAVKAALETKLAELRQKVTGSAVKHPAKFDWRVEFFDVFLDDPARRKPGFDVVLANPPYGIKLDDSVRNLFFNRETEGAQRKDSYGIFLAQAIRLLTAGGTLCFIVSDTWRTIKSHLPLRRRLLTQTVKHFIDLPSWVFDATVNTGILTATKADPADDHQVVAADLRPIPIGDWSTLTANLNAIAHHGPDVQTLTFARYTYPQSLIATYENCSFFIASPKLYRLMSDPRFHKLGRHTVAICAGVMGAKNDFASFDGRRSTKRILPRDVVGRQLTARERQFGISGSGPHFVRFEKGGHTVLENGTLTNYSYASGFYLDWSTRTVARLRKGNQLRNRKRYFQPGVAFTSAGFYSPVFRLIEGAVFEKGLHVMFFSEGVGMKEMTGLLASRPVRFLLKNFENHSVNTNTEDMVGLPIPESAIQCARLRARVQSILNKQATDPAYPYHLHEQPEIDAIIYELYGLDEEDIREVTLWYCRRYRTLAEAQGVLAEAQEKYADHLAWCDFILSKPPGYWNSHPLLRLISMGEGQKLEFKATYSWDVEENRENRELRHEVFKTLGAFRNTQGGDLLIGVEDKGSIVGLGRDLALAQNSRDTLERRIRDHVRNHMDPNLRDELHIEFIQMADGLVARLHVEAREGVQYVVWPDRGGQNQHELWIREGNRSRRLEGRERDEWIRSRR